MINVHLSQLFLTNSSALFAGSKFEETSVDFNRSSLFLTGSCSGRTRVPVFEVSFVGLRIFRMHIYFRAFLTEMACNLRCVGSMGSFDLQQFVDGASG